MAIEEINETVKKYGWQASQNAEGEFLLSNRKGLQVAKVRVKGKSYKIFNSSNTKILSGNKTLSFAIDMVIKDYFFSPVLTSKSN